jgi:hypothetical protein
VVQGEPKESITPAIPENAVRQNDGMKDGEIAKSIPNGNLSEWNKNQQFRARGRKYERAKKAQGGDRKSSVQNEHLQKPERTASAIAKEFARLRSPRSHLFLFQRVVALPRLSCHTEEEIAEACGCSLQPVKDVVLDKTENLPKNLKAAGEHATSSFALPETKTLDSWLKLIYASGNENTKEGSWQKRRGAGRASMPMGRSGCGGFAKHSTGASMLTLTRRHHGG